MISKKLILAAALLAGASALSVPAFARHGYHGHARVGVYLGVPLIGYGYYGPYGYPYYGSPYYSPSPYYYPPAVASPGPQTYIEQSAAPSQAQGYWYYCAESQGYYPYVQQCPAGWQKVAPQPPATAPR